MVLDWQKPLNDLAVASNIGLFYWSLLANGFYKEVSNFKFRVLDEKMMVTF
jgi:hypothetical protein